jgi:hypothetical protein
VRGWCSYRPALRALVRGGALRLLCCHRLEQRLQLLAHSSLLGGHHLWAAAQQHGRSSKVLRRPPEERQCISVRFGVDVRTLVGVSVVVA